MTIRDRVVVKIGEWMDGPDPEEKDPQPIDFFAVIVGWCLAILIVGVWM